MPPAETQASRGRDPGRRTRSVSARDGRATMGEAVFSSPKASRRGFLRRAGGIGAMLGFGGLLAACTRQTPAAAPPAQPAYPAAQPKDGAKAVTLGFGDQVGSELDYGSIWIAQEKGYFKEAGITI